MIGIDWGTTSFRAFRLDDQGAIVDRRAAPRGILAIEGARFEEELLRQVGDWIADGETRVLMAGMIGSRQGWQEAPYVRCPAGAADIAAGAIPVPFAGAALRILPGLTVTDAAGVPDVLRGEETQIVGALAAMAEVAVACLPGSHSKWAEVEGGRITGFATYLSGEAFAALRGHTILGRTMREGPNDTAAFDRGLARAADPGHLLHHLFGVRALALFGALGEAEGASYLSGLLIGHEVRAACAGDGASVHLIGAETLCGLYARAIAARGAQAVVHGEEAAARGLFRLSAEVNWQ
ncbi:MAG: 2-dehydro-3-deoxygalactonokinase [Alphaproteobacteria bacterium]|nr:2-dehydro-3-deoxygalactonokinase [Alphaproteobacteria bacterium]